MSSQQISLTAEPRTVLGKQVRSLRREGIVPAIVYERGKPSVAVSISHHDATHVFNEAGKHHPVNLTIGKDKHLVMIKDVDYEPIKGVLRHIAFHAVNQNETVTAEIPVRLDGDAPAERAGLMVLNTIDHVEVEALPAKLPDELTVDASKLVEVGDSLTIADISAPEGVEIMGEPEQTLYIVEEPRSAAAEAAEEEAAAAAEAATSGEATETPAETTSTEA